MVCVYEAIVCIYVYCVFTCICDCAHVQERKGWEDKVHNIRYFLAKPLRCFLTPVTFPTSYVTSYIARYLKTLINPFSKM